MTEETEYEMLSMSMFANKSDFEKAKEEMKQRAKEKLADPEVKQFLRDNHKAMKND